MSRQPAAGMALGRSADRPRSVSLENMIQVLALLICHWSERQRLERHYRVGENDVIPGPGAARSRTPEPGLPSAETSTATEPTSSR
jgi:hypothetical protein